MNLLKRIEALEKEILKNSIEENLALIFHDVNKREIKIKTSEEKTYKDCDYQQAIDEFQKETGIDFSKSGSLLIRISRLDDDYPELKALKKRIQTQKDLDSDV